MTNQQTDRKSPPWVYVFAVLAVLGLVALVLPWFRPTIGGHTAPGESATHSWNGVIFYFAPILMIILTVRVLRSGRRPGAAHTTCVQAIVVGVLLLITSIAAYALVPSDYKDWDQAKATAAQYGLSLGRGPLFGWWMALGVAVALFVLGLFGLVTLRRLNNNTAMMAPPLPYQLQQYQPQPYEPQSYQPQAYQPQPYQPQPYQPQPYQPQQYQPESAYQPQPYGAQRAEGQHRAP